MCNYMRAGEGSLQGKGFDPIPGTLMDQEGGGGGGGANGQKKLRRTNLILISQEEVPRS